MKVNFFTTWNARCGIAEYSKRLIAELRKLCEVSVVPVIPGCNPFRYQKLGRKMNDADIAHIQYEYGLFTLVNPYIDNYSTLLSQIKISKVVTLHSLFPSFYPKVQSTRSMRNIAYSVRNILYYPYRDRSSKKLYQSADFFIIHTNVGHTRLAELGVDSDRSFCFLHPVPVQRIISFDEHYKVQYGVSKKRVLTLFGFVNPLKGYELVLDILVRLPDDVVLIIAGSVREEKYKRYFETLKCRITEKNLAHRVRITGYLSEEEIGKIMSITDICLAPYVRMDASGSLSMSLAYQKAVVASDLEPNRELSKNFDCLELFSSGDSRSLLEKVNGLLLSPERRMYFSQRAKAYQEEYNYRRLAEETMRVYASLTRT